MPDPVHDLDNSMIAWRHAVSEIADAEHFPDPGPLLTIPPHPIVLIVATKPAEIFPTLTHLIGPDHPVFQTHAPPDLRYYQIALGVDPPPPKQVIRELWSRDTQITQPEWERHCLAHDGSPYLSVRAIPEKPVRGLMYLAMTPLAETPPLPAWTVTHAIVLLPGDGSVQPSFAEQITARAAAVWSGTASFNEAHRLIGAHGLQSEDLPQTVEALLGKDSPAHAVYKTWGGARLANDSSTRIERYADILAARRARIRNFTDRMSFETGVRQARKRLIASIKSILSKEVQRIEMLLSDYTTNTYTIDDPAFYEFESAVNALREDNLLIKSGRSKRMATLTPSTASKLGEIEADAVQHIDRQVEQRVHEMISDLNHRLAAEVAEQPNSGIELHPFELEPFKTSDYTPISSDNRMSFELPAKGFFARLKEGRRTVFSILMIFSIVAGTVGIRRDNLWVALVMLLVFVGAVIATFWTWKLDVNERIDKELEKYRKDIRTRMDRALRERSRGSSTAARVAMMDLSRRVEQHLDIVDRDMEDLERMELTRLRSITRELDQSLRKAEAMVAPARTVSQALRDAAAKAQEHVSAELRNLTDAAATR
ncbi:MAG: hypothetical protein AAF797_00830 [Planctomycetota bacterium]